MNLGLVTVLLLMLHVVMKFNLGQDSEARFGQDFVAQVSWRGWCLVGILKMMLGRDSDYEIWSRFVLELVIWPNQVTLVSTRFSNSGFCHLGVNFFVFCRNLKTKTDLKSLCNFQIECGISKDLMIKFLPKIKKMLFFSVFDLIFLRVFSFFSVKNMSFLVWDHSRL